MEHEAENRLVCQACGKDAKKLIRYYGNHWVCPECLASDMENEVPIVPPVYTVRSDTGGRCKD